MILVVYLGHGIFHPVAVLVFFKSVFGKVLSSQIEGVVLEKKWSTFSVARVRVLWRLLLTLLLLGAAFFAGNASESAGI